MCCLAHVCSLQESASPPVLFCCHQHRTPLPQPSHMHEGQRPPELTRHLLGYSALSTKQLTESQHAGGHRWTAQLCHVKQSNKTSSRYTFHLSALFLQRTLTQTVLYREPHSFKRVMVCRGVLRERKAAQEILLATGASIQSNDKVSIPNQGGYWRLILTSVVILMLMYTHLFLYLLLSWWSCFGRPGPIWRKRVGRGWTLWVT